jgi:hypothetical protein
MSVATSTVAHPDKRKTRRFSIRDGGEAGHASPLLLFYLTSVRRPVIALPSADRRTK